MIDRAYAFNPDVEEAGTLDEHHLLRPIPRSHIELIHNQNDEPQNASEREVY